MVLSMPAGYTEQMQEEFDKIGRTLGLG